MSPSASNDCDTQSPLVVAVPQDVRVWIVQELGNFYGMTIAEISSLLEKAYIHSTKELTPLLRVLGNGLDDPASLSKPS